MTCGADQLYEEISYIAYYFNWAREEILDLDHRTRRRYATEITRINRQLDGSL